MSPAQGVGWEISLYPGLPLQSFPRRSGEQSVHSAKRETRDSPHTPRARSAFRVAVSGKPSPGLRPPIKPPVTHQRQGEQLPWPVWPASQQHYCLLWGGKRQLLLSRPDRGNGSHTETRLRCHQYTAINTTTKENREGWAVFLQGSRPHGPAVLSRCNWEPPRVESVNNLPFPHSCNILKRQ